MRKSVVLGLLCLAIFLSACVGCMVVASPKMIFPNTGAAVETKGSNAGIEPIGDEGGGGRPFSLSSP